MHKYLCLANILFEKIFFGIKTKKTQAANIAFKGFTDSPETESNIWTESRVQNQKDFPPTFPPAASLLFKSGNYVYMVEVARI